MSMGKVLSQTDAPQQSEMKNSSKQSEEERLSEGQRWEEQRQGTQPPAEETQQEDTEEEEDLIDEVTENEELSEQLHSQNPPISAKKTAIGHPDVDAAPQNESSKARRTRLKKAEKAKKGGSRFANAHSYDFHMTVSNLVREREKNREYVRKQTGRGAAYGYALADFMGKSMSGSKKDEMINAFRGTDLEKKTAHLDRFRDQLLGFDFKREMFDMDYLSDHLDEIITSYRQFSAFQTLAKQGGDYYEKMDAETKELIERKHSLVKALFVRAQSVVRAYGVDEQSGKYLEEDSGLTVKSIKRIRKTAEGRVAQTLSECAHRITKRYAVVQGLTEEQWNARGGASFKKIATEQEAGKIKAVSGGFIDYRPVGDSLCEMFPSLPETVFVKGEENGVSIVREIPLRRTYNQLVKCLVRSAFQTDEEGNLLKGEDGRPLIRTDNAFEMFYFDLHDAPDGRAVMASMKPFVEQMYGEKEAEPILENAGAIVQELERFLPGLSSFFIPSEIRRDFGQSAARIAVAQRTKGTLDERKARVAKQLRSEGKSKEEIADQLAAMEKAHEYADQAVDEMTAILAMDDDEADIPLPDSCSANAQLTGALKLFTKEGRDAYLERKAQADQANHELPQARKDLRRAQDALNAEEQNQTQGESGAGDPEKQKRLHTLEKKLQEAQEKEKKLRDQEKFNEDVVLDLHRMKYDTYTRFQNNQLASAKFCLNYRDVIRERMREQWEQADTSRAEISHRLLRYFKDADHAAMVKDEAAAAALERLRAAFPAQEIAGRRVEPADAERLDRLDMKQVKLADIDLADLELLRSQMDQAAQKEINSGFGRYQKQIDNARGLREKLLVMREIVTRYFDRHPLPELPEYRKADEQQKQGYAAALERFRASDIEQMQDGDIAKVFALVSKAEINNHQMMPGETEEQRAEKMYVDEERFQDAESLIVTNTGGGILQKQMKYDYHYAGKAAKMEDGKLYTTEAFAAESREYVVTPFTRNRKAVGDFEQVNGKIADESFQGHYRMDDAEPSRQDQAVNDIKERAAIYGKMPGEADPQ